MASARVGRGVRMSDLLLVAVLLGLAGAACAAGGGNGEAPSAAADPYEALRLQMVAGQIEARGIQDPCVLEAMRRVPRHRFVPEAQRREAYSDWPLAIGFGQTISQPYIVALMTELLRPDKTMKVFEVGTGSGYQAAVLAECVAEVYTIEIIPELGQRAEKLLRELGYENVHVRIGDGYEGWPEAAPFDGILVTAAPEDVPPPLLEQLAVGGRLVVPLGRGLQELVVITRTPEGYERREITGVRFVPMTGKAQERD